MEKLKIGFDVDNVICRFDAAFLEYVEEVHGERINLNEIHDYDVLKKIVESYAGDMELNCLLKGDHKCLLYADPVDDALDIVNSGLGEGHDIYLITARKNKSLTIEWLEWNNFRYSEIFFAPGDEKVYVIEELDLDFYIDDRIQTLISIKKAGLKTECVVLDYPWNRGCLHC